MLRSKQFNLLPRKYFKWTNLSSYLRHQKNILENENTATSLKLQHKCYSEKKDSETWQDGAKVYSTSKASKHRVNKSFGLDSRDHNSIKPLIFGSLTFCIILYFMFIRKGERNDIFEVDMTSYYKSLEDNDDDEEEEEEESESEIESDKV